VDTSFTVCLFLCVFVCTVTDFSAKDKASRIKFCTVVHWRPGQGISHLGELCSPEAQNRTKRPERKQRVFTVLEEYVYSDVLFIVQ